jgi:hypothetical protein
MIGVTNDDTSNDDAKDDVAENFGWFVFVAHGVKVLSSVCQIQTPPILWTSQAL